jgi:UDP-N-acetylmuramoyl-L-alanyl-D-glutamate--2,6-diaminopimelate ligase
MKIKDLLDGVPTMKFSGKEEAEVQGIAYSSQAVGQDYLFAALKGEKKDGYDFVPNAIERGAAAILSERPVPSGFDLNWIEVKEARKSLALCSANFYLHPSRHLKVVGITGTKGKTTITYILESILKNSNLSPGVIGTISYRGPGLNMTAERTTPEAPDLQRMMKAMVEQNASHCLMEVSSHSLELDRVTGIHFDVVAFTNLSGEHLDYHHTIEKYFEAKKKLFLVNQEKRTAVINTDDDWGNKLTNELHTKTITYGLNPGAMIRAEEYSLSENGIVMVLRYPNGKMNISSSLLGRPNVYNILAAVAVALTLNVPEVEISKGISSLRKVPGRFERIRNPLGFHIFVDYAHNDDALRNLLETVKELARQKIILVFGAGGDRDKSKRPRMGKVAASLADHTIITSDNPRSEDPRTIISDIEQGMKNSGYNEYEVEVDRRKAIEHALAIAAPGDYVLVAGKGHENYQIIGDRVIPFNDIGIIRELLERKTRMDQIG